MPNPAKTVTPDRLMQFAWGYAPTLIIEAAVRERLFDRLEREPRSAAELAQATGASARGLRAVLNALVALDLLKRMGDRYALTPESAAFLVSSRPGYRGSFFDHHTRHLLPQWMQLSEVLRSGCPARKTNDAHGANYFAEFVESLFPVNETAATALAQHLGVDMAAAPLSVLDIGAGSGVWGIALARLSSHVRVRAVDWPEVLEVTRRVAVREGVAERLTTVPGDFLDADFGQGHQIATLGHILHSEGPDRIRQLLRKTWEALAPCGVIAIQEFLPNDDRTGPPHALIFAVNMLVNTEAGDTYTVAEITTWLREAGFVDTRSLEVAAPSPLILANKPRTSATAAAM